MFALFNGLLFPKIAFSLSFFSHFPRWCFHYRFPLLFPAGGLARVRGAEAVPKRPVWFGLAPNKVPAELKDV